MHLKMSSAKCRLFCLGFNVLTDIYLRMTPGHDVPQLVNHMPHVWWSIHGIKILSNSSSTTFLNWRLSLCAYVNLQNLWMHHSFITLAVYLDLSSIIFVERMFNICQLKFRDLNFKYHENMLTLSYQSPWLSQLRYIHTNVTKGNIKPITMVIMCHAQHKLRYEICAMHYIYILTRSPITSKDNLGGVAKCRQITMYWYLINFWQMQNKSVVCS